MATTTRRRSKTTNLTRQVIDQVGELLRELPEKPKEKLSLREAVDQLQDQIKATLANGYSYDEVATMLTNQGIEISAATLKRYVPAGRNKSAKRAATGTRTRRPRGSKTDKTDAPSAGTEAAIDLPTEPAATTDVPAPAPESTAQATATPTRKRGRAAAKSKAEPTTEVEAEAPAKPANGRRRRASTEEASSETKKAGRSSTRSSSTRRRK